MSSYSKSASFYQAGIVGPLMEDAPVPGADHGKWRTSDLKGLQALASLKQIVDCKVTEQDSKLRIRMLFIRTSIRGCCWITQNQCRITERHAPHPIWLLDPHASPVNRFTADWLQHHHHSRISKDRDLGPIHWLNRHHRI